MVKKRTKLEQIGLIGLVVLLLATFSITGALTQCGGPPSSGGIPLGGSFEVAPGERAEISDSEFDERHKRYNRAANALNSASWKLRDVVGGRILGGKLRWAGWMHLATSEAAAKAGYVVGEDQLRARIREMVGGAMRQQGLGFTDALYQEFLRRRFRGSQSDFEAVLKEIIAKDLFITPIVRTAAYSVSYPEAFEDWKQSRERVDLGFVAVAGDGFADIVKAEETTRQTIEEQQRDLRDLGRVSASIRLLVARAASYEAREKVPPEDLDAVLEGAAHLKEQTDPWGEPFNYRVTDGAPDLRSAGPDKTLDTDDDVTIDVSRAYDTHGSLLRVARGLATWHKATEAWPSTLAELLTAPGDGLLAPIKLQSELEDAWGNTLTYTAPTGDAAPALTSSGADGTAGNDDDLTVSVGLETTDVVPSGAVARYVAADAKDAWDRALRMVVRDPSPLRWTVSSDGADGERGTDDDLDTGNQAELGAFFRDRTVRASLQKPATREFEMLYAHMPELTDEVLTKLWAKYPQHRPSSEEDAFEEYRQYRDPIYGAADPGDAESGHGAALLAEVAPDGVPNLVPGKDVFPNPIEGTAPDGAEDDASEDDASEDDASEDDASEDDASDDDASDEDASDEDASDEDASEVDDDGEDAADERLTALRNDFETKGWREIVIRDMFIERLLADLLQRARTSSDALRAWEMKYGSQLGGDEPAEGDAGNDGAKPVPPKPEVWTLERLLSEELGDDLGFQIYRSKGAVTNDSWMEDPALGGFTLRTAMAGLSRDGEYTVIPTQLHNRLTKAIIRNIKFNPSLPPEMEDVRDELMAKFVAKRQVDRAAKLLTDLKEQVTLAPAGDATEGDEAASTWDATLAEWAAETKVPHYVESTGWIIGSARPPTINVDDTLPEEEQARLRRLRFVLQQGYATVASLPSQQDTLEASPGALGRRVLTDPETGTAYLVRVRDRKFPDPSEFSPRRYADYLRRKAFGPMSQERGNHLRDNEGSILQSAANWFDDMAWFKETFDLRTTTDIMTLDVEERTR